MKSKNLMFLLIISIIAISMYACVAPTKTGEVAKPSTESKAEEQKTEVKKTIEGADQYESNNSIEKAAKIEVGSEIEGTIYPRGDKDFYKFTFESKTSSGEPPFPFFPTLSIEMTNPGGRVEPVMVVHGPDGGIYRKRPPRRGADLTVKIMGKSGDYYVEISDQKRGQSTKPYVLKVTAEKAEKEMKPSEEVDLMIK